MRNDRCIFDSSIVCGSTNLDDCIDCNVGPGPRRVPARQDDTKALAHALRACRIALHDLSRNEATGVLAILVAEFEPLPERCEDIAASEEALIVETCAALGLKDGDA